jgi:hypothetical protein
MRPRQHELVIETAPFLRELAAEFGVTGTRPDYRWVIDALQVMQRLAAYAPVVIGTPPLSLYVADSDIDIACHAPDLDGFVAILAREFGQLPSFDARRIEARSVPSVACTFTFAGWVIEIFGQNVPLGCVQVAGRSDPSL